MSDICVDPAFINFEIRVASDVEAFALTTVQSLKLINSKVTDRSFFDAKTFEMLKNIYTELLTTSPQECGRVVRAEVEKARDKRAANLAAKNALKKKAALEEQKKTIFKKGVSDTKMHGKVSNDAIALSREFERINEQAQMDAEEDEDEEPEKPDETFVKPVFKSMAQVEREKKEQQQQQPIVIPKGKGRILKL